MSTFVTFTTWASSSSSKGRQLVERVGGAVGVGDGVLVGEGELVAVRPSSGGSFLIHQ